MNTIVGGLCHRCGKRFYKEVAANNPVEVKWCSKACRKRGQENKRLHLADKPCPRPSKLVYSTMEAAEAAIREIYPDEARMYAYRCQCGAIHIGNAYRPPAEAVIAIELDAK